LPDARVPDLGKELGNRLLQNRVDRAWRDFGQGHQHESPLVQARVGYLEPGQVHDPVAEQQDVDVTSRTAPFRNGGAPGMSTASVSYQRDRVTVPSPAREATARPSRASRSPMFEPSPRRTSTIT
jgi:hypothetical protein